MSHDEPRRAKIARRLWNSAAKFGVILPTQPNPRPIEDRSKLGHYPVLDGEHPTAWEFPDSLDNPSCAWLQAIKALYAEPIIFPASLSPDAGLFVHAMIRNLRPRTIVEIGSFLSVSTHWMAAAFLDTGKDPATHRIHCFDEFGPVHKGPWRDAEMLEGRLEWVKDRLRAAGLIDFVEFHPGDSSTTLTASAGLFERGVDFAFIDGDHSVEGATKDFVAVDRVINTGGYVLLHDTFPDQCGDHQGPRYIIDHINKIGGGAYEQCELYLAPLNYGMSIIRRIG